MSEEYRNYSYTDLDWNCRLLATRIIRDNQSPAFDAILAVAGDGLFVGCLLSQYLEIPEVWVIGVNKDHEERLFTQIPNPVLFIGQTVLIVDMISQTGKTLEKITDFLTCGLMGGIHSAHVKSAVVSWLISPSNTQSVFPDYYVDRPESGIFLRYPWTKSNEKE